MKIVKSGRLDTEAIEVIGDGFRYEFWPNCGGILNKWEMLRGGEWKPIMSAFESVMDFKANFGDKGFPSCKLSPYACRIRDSHFRFEGKDYYIGKFGYDRHNIHGLLFDYTFDIDRIAETDEGVAIVLTTKYKGEDNGYPFFYDMEVQYLVNDSGGISIRTTVENTGDMNLPLVDGWHPYFSLSEKIDDSALFILPEEVLQFDDDLMPTGRRATFNDFNSPERINGMQLDNCFPLNGKTGLVCSLSYDEVKLEICAWNNYDYLQLFIPPDRKSIAIELLSGAPDAFNNGMGLLVLSPGESRNFECSYNLTQNL